MDVSKEIKEITEIFTICAAIATYGSEWEGVSAEKLDDRAREIGYKVAEVIRRRKAERDLFD